MAHVVSASLGALGPLLVKLTGLLADEYGRLKSVRRQIMPLRYELASMEAAVRKYSMLEDPDIQVKQWISMVRELAYDIEDCIDIFIYRIGNGGRQSGFKDFFCNTTRQLKALGARRGIADQIDELKARIRHVKELKNSYNLDATTCSMSSHIAVDPRLCAIFAEETNLVGIDGPRDDLAKWIVDEKVIHSRVLSIVGFGGLGKTTLANEPNIRKIINDLIYKLPHPDGFTNNSDIWDEITSIAKLRELLQDKRYLIIIDDLWCTQAWSTIKCALPENNCSSRIIATTRIRDVARSCCPSYYDCVYDMEALSDLHSEILFHKRTFGSENCCPNTLKEVSDKILKKCGGLPLAIITISSLLANKPVVKVEWEKVNKSIGSTLENNKSQEGMNSILCLSYNDLSPNLKTCLLYLSVFPEDYTIDRDKLVRRWIAEGFISEECGQCQQEVAENYFYELINKSLVQPVLVEFEALRVLDFEDCEGLDEYDMHNMDKLFNLKYLSYRCTGISKLPSGIVMLGELETLDLRDTCVQELSSGIVQLIKLQHLLVAVGTKIPNGIGVMRNLRVILGFNITRSPVAAVEDLGDLTRLSELDIYLDGGGPEEYKRLEQMLLSSLCKLSDGKLMSLRITRYGGSLEFLDSWSPLPFSLQIFYMSSDCYFVNVPKWIAPTLNSLTYLDINLTELTEKGLLAVGELPTLLCLELWLKTGPKDRLIIVKDMGFPSLREFSISGEAEAYVTFMKGAMPRLEKLGIPCLVSVATTYDFYIGIEHLTCLKQVIVVLGTDGCAPSESKAAAAAIRNEAVVNLNHPTITIFGEPRDSK
ncbi:disease resistance protein RGA5 [Triticum aestivum]|uniref:disease resistance protein RGA5 n=1 Tax=Triticum aestivum TaxID=4565 RepID=UPI001D02DE69|nr:disease resistance protein RGA5-like [Triticum aestivum]